MKHLLFGGVTFIFILALTMTGCVQINEPDEYDWDQIEKDIDASVDEFNNRKIYSTLDPDTLISIPDDKLEQAVFDYITEKIGEDWNREREVVESLGPGFRAHYATWLLEAEVNNGGYNQFFWNSSGYWIHDAIDGFRLFGVPEFAENAEKALRIHSHEQDVQDQFKAQGTLEAFSESYEHTDLGSVDDEFFGIDIDLQKAKIKYIREKPSQFSGD